MARRKYNDPWTPLGGNISLQQAVFRMLEPRKAKFESGDPTWETDFTLDRLQEAIERFLAVNSELDQQVPSQRELVDFLVFYEFPVPQAIRDEFSTDALDLRTDDGVKAYHDLLHGASHMRPTNEEERETLARNLGPMLVDYYAERMPMREFCRKWGIRAAAWYQELARQDRDPRQGYAGDDLRQQERLQRALSLYQEGETLATIQAQTGIASKAVYEELTRRGLPTRRAKIREEGSIDVEHALALYQQGVVIGEIRQRTGVHLSTLYAELRARNIPFRRVPTRGMSPEDLEKHKNDVLEWYELGHTLTEISSAFEVSVPTIYRWLDEAGVPRRRDR